MNSKVTYLARCGYKGGIYLSALLAIAVFFGFGKMSFVLLLLLAIWVFMFRNPERVALHLSENAILSPIDGEIKEIQSTEDTVKIVIASKIFDVGVIRSPMNIQSYEISNIYGIPLYFSKKQKFFASQISFEFARGKMIFSPYLFHIYPLHPKTTLLERGERMGFMKDGEVELEIKNLEVKLNVGDKVRGGESVLGYLQ